LLDTALDWPLAELPLLLLLLPPLLPHAATARESAAAAAAPMVMRRRPRLVPAGFWFMVIAPRYVPLLRVARE
jgi:hypothetical protein